MTLTVTAVNRYTFDHPPALLLTATSSDSAASDYVDVWRIHGDGTEHRVLTGANPRLSGGVWTGLDYHAPFNQSVTYRVDGSESGSSAAAWVSSSQTWLIHASEPELSVKVDSVRAIADRTRATRSVRFQPLAGGVTFLTDGVRNGVTGSLTVKVSDEEPLDALLDDDSVVLLNTPGTTGWDLAWLWLQPLDVAFQNPGGFAGFPFRWVQIGFEQSEQPDVDSVAVTCGTAATFAATCGAYAALYATCGAAATDTRV